MTTPNAYEDTEKLYHSSHIINENIKWSTTLKNSWQCLKKKKQYSTTIWLHIVLVVFNSEKLSYVHITYTQQICL